MRTFKPLTAFMLVAAAMVKAHAAPCGPADINEDGFVDFTDYLEFLNRFDAGDLSVDFTGDGLVDFSDYLEFLNLYEAGCAPACATATELAANPLSAFPFANFVQTYVNGAPVSIAVDPGKTPGLTGKTTRVYITANRTWAVGDALTDVRGSGFQTITWPGGSVAANTFTLTGSTSSLPFDAGEDIGVGYDLVIDENNNGVFDECDSIDGAGSEGGFYKIGDLTLGTTTEVTTINVNIPAERVGAGFEAERWFYPTNIASRGQLPLIVITPAAGGSVDWYEPLGRHLASYGHIVMCHRANNAAGDGLPSGSTSVLDHINSMVSLLPALAEGVLVGHINQSEIYLIGHQRGGESAVFARDRLRRGLYTPTGGFPLVISASDIKYIQAIGPTDFGGAGRAVGGGTAFTDPGAVDFMLLYGSADGVVCGCPSGTNTSWAFSVYERAAARRGSVYIQGVDSNDFACCGVEDFTGPIDSMLGRVEAQKLQRAYTIASIKHWRQGNIPAGEVLWRQYESFKPGATLATATVDFEFKDAGAGRKFVIDDFQSAPSSAVSSSGGSVSFTVTNVTEGQMRDLDTGYTWTPADPFNGMSRARPGDTTSGVVFDYDSSAPSRGMTFDVVPSGGNTTAYRYLSFRAAQGTQHPFTVATLADQVFEVELEDGAGNTSRIRISAYGGGIEEPYQRAGPGDGPGWQNEFETIRVRLEDFTADGRTLDLANIAKVRFLFGSSHGTNQGRIALDDVEFVK